VNDRKPADEEARQAIRSSLGVTMLVEAAAGTGKTTSLVGRMVNLVRKGNASASNLAAITFTVKAAAQLRQRFQEEIERALAVEGDGAISREADRPAPEEATAESRRLRAALEEIDRGFIGTTHAFCARLLRERPVEAGLDPEFEELDAASSEPLTAEFWNRWYEEQSFAGNPLLGEALEVGLDRKTLRGAFEKIVDYPDVILVAQRSERPDLRAVSDKLVRLVENVEPHLPSDADRDDPDQFEKMVVKLLRQRRSSDLDEPFEQFALLDEGDHAQHKPVQKRWPDGRVAKALWEEYSEFVVNELRPALQRWREHVHGIALDVLRPAAGTFAAERRLHGTLTFQDLLVCARDLLRDHPVVRRYFQRRFTHLLVDEFQDTDPLQAEVLFYLTGEDLVEKNWRKLRPRPGSLFIVGDPKQSIYRFRRADITTYLDVRNRIDESGGEIHALSTNFRSGPAVCDFVNDAFVTLFTKEDVEAGRQAPHVDLIPFHSNQPAAIYGLETPDVRPYAAAEAERIGQWILRSVSAQPSVPSSGESPRFSSMPPVASNASSDSTGDADGIRDARGEDAPSAFVMERWNATTGAPAALDRQLTLFPPTTPSFIRSSSEETPPASRASDTVHAVDSRTAPQSAAGDPGALRYSDILLISWQRPNLTYYARTFERLGIPYEITGSKAFSRFAELESVMPLLRAMIDPDDEVSVVAFLRGPLNGADDDALYRFVQAGGKFSAFRDVPDATDERIAAGLAIIHTAIMDARQHPPAATIARLFDRLGLLPLAAAASERPGTRSGNLLLALNIARASSARGESLAAIVEQFDDLLATNPDIGELDVDPARSDAVQLMNLHQVKGLEAKVVFLIDPTDPYERAVEFHVDRRDDDRAGDHGTSDEARGYFVVTRPWGRGTKVLGAPPGWKNAPHGWKASEQEAVWTGYEERENEFQRAERQRLLYVAATRAKEMLVVGFRRARKGVSGPWRELAGRLVDPLPMPDEAASSPAPEPAAVRLFAEARREIALRFEAATETSYSVLPITKIAHSNHRDLVRAEEGLGKGMSWGRVLHRLFEAMLRQESIDIRLYAENLLKDEERDVAQLSEVMRVVDAVKSSPLWRRAKAAEERYVEIPFAIEVPAAELGLGGPAATLLHGTIDLVFREGNEWFVVDYKTDSIANRLDALTDYYTAQVRLYASFWSRLTSAPASGGLFFVDGCVERWVARTA
jgi:ATP-dependent exoDNAse (exonuclease V) beta subunit